MWEILCSLLKFLDFSNIYEAHKHFPLHLLASFFLSGTFQSLEQWQRSPQKVLKENAFVIISNNLKLSFLNCSQVIYNACDTYREWTFADILLPIYVLFTNDLKFRLLFSKIQRALCKQTSAKVFCKKYRTFIGFISFFGTEICRTLV